MKKIWLSQSFKIYQWIFLFSLITFVKQLIVENSMEGVPLSFSILSINFLLLLSLFSLSGLFPGKNLMLSLLSIHTLISCILFSDLVHYRYFHMPISIFSLHSISQVASVGSTIKILVSGKDLLLFLDILLLWVFSQRKKIISPEIKGKKKILLTGIFVTLTMTLAFAGHHLAKDGPFTVSRLGLMNYHLQDLNTYMGNIGKPAEEFDPHLLSWVFERAHPKEGRYFGVAAGRNIFVIQVEAMQNFILNRTIEGQPITPVMNTLLKQDTLYFDRYYQQLGRGNTSDAEFVSHNSLYPSMRTFSYKEYEGNKFYTLPLVLKEKGYSTIAFHGNDPDFWNRKNIYPSQGFDRFISKEEFIPDEMIGMGISDGSLFRQSISHILQLPQPFYSFYVTLTSHHPFLLPPHLQGLKIKGEFKDTLLGNYFQSMHYFDRVLGEFIDRLKKEGLYENSIIVIYGDHFGIDMRDRVVKRQISSFLRKEYDFDEFLNVGLLIHIPGLGKAERYSIAGGQIDFFPTMLNLVGINEITGFILGQDLLNSENGFVAQQTYMVKGSFIDNDKIFVMSRDGKFENSRAWNLHTGKPVPLETCRDGYERAIREINLSSYILYHSLSTKREIDIELDQEILFIDILGHKSQKAIEFMYKSNIIAGYPDGRFYPDDPIKKGEFLKVLAHLLDWQEVKEYSPVSHDEHWAVPYIKAAFQRGILPPNEDQLAFNPEEILPFEEAMTWILFASCETFLPLPTEIAELESQKPLDRGKAMLILYEITQHN